jgi:recombination protein RecR
VNLPETLERLVAELAKLPGIGRRTAERLADHLVRVPERDAMELAVAIRDAKRSIRSCSVCHHVAEVDPCELCSDPTRDREILCVVEEPRHVLALEGSGAFRGLYHVLGGRVAPLEGTGTDDLAIDHLVRRVREESFREVILATSPDLEGDGTAAAVQRALAPTGVRITRLARGVPAGSRIEYASRAVLSDALSGRRGIEGAASEDPPPSENGSTVSDLLPRTPPPG